MYYSYICQECGSIKEIKSPMAAKRPVRFRCKTCLKNGKESWMKRDWGNAGKIIIPDIFKSTSIANEDGPTSLSHLKRIMEHSHPSGREGPIYHQVPDMQHIHKAE